MTINHTWSTKTKLRQADPTNKGFGAGAGSSEASFEFSSSWRGHSMNAHHTRPGQATHFTDVRITLRPHGLLPLLLLK